MRVTGHGGILPPGILRADEAFAGHRAAAVNLAGHALAIQCPGDGLPEFFSRKDRALRGVHKWVAGGIASGVEIEPHEISLHAGPEVQHLESATRRRLHKLRVELRARVL